MPTPEETQDWPGRKLVTSEDDAVGEIDRIYIDRDSEQPKFAVVKTGLLGRNSTVVPIVEAELHGEDVQVPFSKATIKDAPETDHGEELPPGDEQAILDHYGVSLPEAPEPREPEPEPAAGSPAAQEAEREAAEPAPEADHEPDDAPAPPAAVDTEPAGRADDPRHETIIGAGADRAEADGGGPAEVDRGGVAEAGAAPGPAQDATDGAITVCARMKVEDFDAFLEVFRDHGASLRMRHGSAAARLLRSTEDPDSVLAIYEWESRARFDAFREDPEMRDVIEKAGILGTPEFTFFEMVGDFPA